MKKSFYILVAAFSAIIIQCAPLTALADDYFHVKADTSAFVNNPNIDPTRSLYGKIAGLNLHQGNGISSDKLTSLKIHGNSPLVIIDGAPRDIRDVTTYEIESIEILKDACALALYGVRGANGVVIINTKKANPGKLKISANYHFGISEQFRSPKFADAYTYASSINSAMELDGLSPRYNEMELDAFKNGTYPAEYPDIDWWNQVYNDYGYNHRFDVTFSGGSDRFRYYAVVDYMHDTGFFRRNTTDDRYDTNPTDQRLNLRTNLDVKLTRSTTMRLGLMAKIAASNRANIGNLYSALYNTPSAAFPVMNYDLDILGGNSVYGASNPYALITESGNYGITRGSLYADLDIRQDLSIITPGLSARAYVAFDNIGLMYDQSNKEYRYMDSQASITEDGTLVTNPVIYGKDSQTLSHSSGLYSLALRSEFRFSFDYERTFNDKHSVSAYILYEQNTYTGNGRNNSVNRLTSAAGATYNYDSRYELSVAVATGASSYLPKGSRFNWYPAVNLVWNIGNEHFWNKGTILQDWKLFASAGISGYDGNLSHELAIQSYGSDGASQYYFTNNVSRFYAKTEGRLGAENLSPESSRKITAGSSASLFDGRLDLYVEGFWERRSNILVSSASAVSGIIGIGTGTQSSGINSYSGLDFSASWNHTCGKFNYGLYATGALLESRIIDDFQAYQQYDYLYHKGNAVGQRYGLEVIGIFQNQMEINNSPVQTFSTVRPGDLKYKDQNGDNRIDDEDIVKMFGSSLPHLYYGFGINIGYGGFKLNADFQGMAGLTINLLDSPLYQPLVNNGNISKTFLDREVPWSPEKASEATMPRLTTLGNPNNYRNNSLWYRDGSFLKLRLLKLSYTIKKEWMKFASMEVYVSGTDLFSFDAIRFADPEQLPAAYPASRAYWTGIKFNF